MDEFEVNQVIKASGQLEELKKDGLLKWEDGKLSVTRKGRPFVRNICMAFDERLLSSNPETQIFSMTV